MRNLLLASTSSLHGQSPLYYLKSELWEHFADADRLLFIPYARPGGISHDDYTNSVAGIFSDMDITVEGIHNFDDPVAAIENAQAIFTGGGNTFVLVNALHKLGLMEPLRKVLFNGTPYLGTSAGSNICGINMMTTNDMPIVYPPSFKTLGLIPFNINPHYLDPIPDSKHMGETRETRINEFHTQNKLPVVGLREGSWLQVSGDAIILNGIYTARLFLPDQKPREVQPGYDFSGLS